MKLTIVNNIPPFIDIRATAGGPTTRVIGRLAHKNRS